MATITMTESSTYSTKPLYNITSNTFSQLFSRKAMGKLWAKRKELDDGQADLIDCLYKATKKRGTAKCESHIEYKRSSNVAGKLGYGRYYGSKGSLEQLEKDIRGTLCSEYYDDIDVVNCHPTIIPQMAKKWFNFEMPAMMKYVNNRSYYFNIMREKMGFSDDMTKSLILRILYGGAIKTTYTLPDDCDIEMPQEFLDMKKEMFTFTNKLMKVEEHKELLEHLQKQHKPNIVGSFTSYIIQSEERKILECMVNILNTKGFRVDVLAYDGCQVRKEDKQVTSEVLLELEEQIKQEVEYDIKLKIKPFETMGFDDDEKEDNKEAYNNMKEEWEKNHFYFKPANTLVEVTEDGITHYGIEHATEAFNTWLLPSKEKDGKKELFLKEWRADETRRIVDKFVYKMPEECQRNECSLFTGFDYKKITMEVSDEKRADAIATFKDIVSAICDDEELISDYVTKGFAHMIQKPFEKTGVIVAFASPTQGTGKDTAMLIMKRIIGDNHTAHYTSTEAYWDKYDTQQEGAILVYLEEACSALNKAKQNDLKARITAEQQTINPKGVKAYNVPNIGRQYMTTNETEPFKFEETDRRSLLVAPGTRLVNTDWVKIYSKILTPEYIKAVGEYLESIDINEWKPRQIPETHVKKEMKLLSKSSEKAFFEQWVGTGTFTSTEVYNLYRDYCIETSLPYAQNVVSFGKKCVAYQNKLFKFERGVKNIALYAPLNEA